MDRHSELIIWLRKMGYDGEIPESLNNIHNNSTSFLWEQLIQNARPRQEVQHVRDNIIVHRLKSKPINKQDEFSSPMLEIALYQKKVALANKLESMYAAIKEKETIHTNMSQNIRMKSIAIEKLNEKIKANQEREFLLRKKLKVSQQDIQSAEDTLESLGNLTPVELEEKPNTKEITQTLKKCAEILEKQLHTFPAPSKNVQNYEQTFQRTRTVEKSRRDPSVYEHYICLTEKKQPRRNDSSRREEKFGKENVRLKNVTKCLFDSPSIGKQPARPKKRESLGLLSESCMNNSEPEDFLVEADPLSTTLSVVQEDIGTVSVSSAVQENLLSRMHGRDVTSVSTTTLVEKKNDDLKKLCENKEVCEQLMQLLHCHNRQMIWNVFQSMDHSVHLDISKNLVLDHQKAGGKINQDDISQLRFLHVQNEFKILKQKAMLKQLEHQVDAKKKNVHVFLSDRGISAKKLEKLFELLYRDANLDATLTAMKKEITAAKSSQEKIDLLIVSGKLAKVKENIETKLFSIQKNIGAVQEILTLTSRTRNETIACVHKLVPFIDDMSWSSPLVEGLFSDEIRTFEKFPLEYNRRSVHVDPSIFYKDLCISNLPSDEDIDDQTLYILGEALENPSSFPEIVVFNILKAKLKLDVLKSMQKVPEISHQQKYTFEDLESQESYVQYALERLNTLLHSTSTMRTLNSAASAKKVMDIWLEMPLKDFISPNIKVDGNEYSFYEKQYDRFYNDL
ncbi:unnamed protein product [Phaedon cochleariae]|uniref:Uncharacterized protein n=1 Tax=Phaedon cochleariae TaxID=80249 RepID=A0A9N9SHH1_PHACE|nr:unnamed protein product [Phaedon cochleariae]